MACLKLRFEEINLLFLDSQECHKWKFKISLFLSMNIKVQEEKEGESTRLSDSDFVWESWFEVNHYKDSLFWEEFNDFSWEYLREIKKVIKSW